MKNKIFILVFLIILSVNNSIFASIGYENNTKAYLLADYETGQILESYNIDTPIEIASITKLLSYYVIKDEISKGKIGYYDKVIIDKDTTNVKGSSYKLKEGEEFTVDKLLKASIIVSGNDATYAMAKHVAGTEAEFVMLMREKARNLGLFNAEIYNSSGLPINNDGLQNKMTTREIFILTKSLLNDYPEVLELSRIPFISEPSRGFLEMNTNPLLRSIDGIDGLKTGYTGKAGYCFVSTFNIKGEPRVSEDLRLIGVIMGANSYDERTLISRELIEYGKDNYIKQVFINKELSLDTLTFKMGHPFEIEIYPEEDFSQLVEKSSNIELDIKLKNNTLPIKENTSFGTVTVLKDKEPLFTTNIINKEKVDKASFLILASRFYQGLFSKAEAIFANDLSIANWQSI